MREHDRHRHRGDQSLASAHRLLREEQADEFARLFLNEQIHYPNVYPAFFKDEGINQSPFPVYPLPKTAQSCKRFPGFFRLLPSEKDEEERHGVRDTLLDWATFALLRNELPQSTLIIRLCKQLLYFLHGVTLPIHLP